MPFFNKWVENGMEKIASGHVTGDELIATRKELYGDERFDQLEYILSDYTFADSVQILEKDIKQVAYLDGAAAMSNPNCKVAIVAPTKIMKPLADYYAELSKNSPWDARVFETVEQAKEWLKTVVRIG